MCNYSAPLYGVSIMHSCVNNTTLLINLRLQSHHASELCSILRLAMSQYLVLFSTIHNYKQNQLECGNYDYDMEFCIKKNKTVSIFMRGCRNDFSLPAPKLLKLLTCKIRFWPVSMVKFEKCIHIMYVLR